MAATQSLVGVSVSSCSVQIAANTRQKFHQRQCTGCGRSSIRSEFQHPNLRPSLLPPTSPKLLSFVQSPLSRRRAVLTRAAEKDENVPSWAKPGSDEVPPWAKEDKSGYQKEGPTELPFGLYLLFSVFTAIAAVGSIYEYSNKNAIFGVIESDSGLYAPILGFFAVTGFPTAGFLLWKAISSANKLADDMDKEDGVNNNF